MRIGTTLLLASALAMGVLRLQAADKPVETPSRDELADEPVARAVFWRLLQRSRYGFDAIEHAAFLIRHRDGTLSWVDWPEGERNAARWEGAYPAGVVAIAHTHRNWQGQPSKVDIASARRIGLPIYVVTRNGISKTERGSVETVLHGDWTLLVAQQEEAHAPQRASDESGRNESSAGRAVAGL
jgi:hypothetical protein